MIVYYFIFNFFLWAGMRNPHLVILHKYFEYGYHIAFLFLFKIDQDQRLICEEDKKPLITPDFFQAPGD